MSMTKLIENIDTLIQLLVLKDLIEDFSHHKPHSIEYKCRVLDKGQVCHVHLSNLDNLGEKTHWRYMSISLDLSTLTMSGDWVTGREVLFTSNKSDGIDEYILKQMKQIRKGFVETHMLPKRVWEHVKEKELIMVKDI